METLREYKTNTLPKSVQKSTLALSISRHSSRLTSASTPLCLHPNDISGAYGGLRLRCKLKSRVVTTALHDKQTRLQQQRRLCIEQPTDVATMDRIEQAERDGAHTKPKDSMAIALAHAPLLRMRELYRPVMVTVSVDDSPHEYVIPRALICGQSAYFAKAFSERFKEGQDRVLRLPDVAWDIFEVFVGWLYTQRVCYDPSDGDEIGDDGGEGESEYDDAPDLELEAGQSTLRSWLLSKDGSQRLGKRKRDATELGDEPDASADGAKRVRKVESPTDQEYPDEAPVEDRNATKNAGEGEKSEAKPVREPSIGQEEQISTRDDDDAPIDDDCENDADDPITWDWEFLLDVYVFADQYDTRHFRSAVISIIQIKSLQSKPRYYLKPSAHEMARVFGQLPQSSPLYKFLVDILVWYLSPGEVVEEWDVLPSEVLAAAWLKTKRLEAFRSCSLCLGRTIVTKGVCGCVENYECIRCQPCDSITHKGLNTALPSYLQDMCQYHEHESEEEKALCRKRWQLITAERDIE